MYADISDFFYVWLRRGMRSIFPELFSTIATPKDEELVATPYRHDSGENAEQFFIDGMTKAMSRLYEQSHPAYPVTIYYAFKQSEIDSSGGVINTGWDTFLAAVIKAGFSITGTWPMRTELTNRMIGSGANALASSIVLVCRPRSVLSETVAFRDFVNALKKELPDALRNMRAGNIAPVDLAQATIGPGIAVFTRYASVLDSEGSPLSVRSALMLINEILDEILTDQEGDFDSDTRWALAWFEENGFKEADFGQADILARAKGTAVNGLVEAGIISSGRSKVKLLAISELPNDWDPLTDKRLTIWEIVHHLIKAQETGGEVSAAEIVGKIRTDAESAKELCYRLYSLCERKKRAADAIVYNNLVQSWPEITRLAQNQQASSANQPKDLFSGD